MKYNLAKLPQARQMNRQAENNKGISVFLPKFLTLVLLEGKANQDISAGAYLCYCFLLFVFAC